jgi:hypothetical protein
MLGAIVALAAAPALASDTSPFLDKPLKIVRVPLPRDPDNPPAKPELSCSYYPHFAVKQVDLGELGADQLSILADGSLCRRENAANEKIISAKDWTGYFEGVKGDYIFFTAEDGWNDGLGFAVFTAGARKLFEDVAKKMGGRRIAPVGHSAALRTRLRSAVLTPGRRRCVLAGNQESDRIDRCVTARVQGRLCPRTEADSQIRPPGPRRSDCRRL